MASKQIKSVFIKRQVDHIRLVQDCMIYLENNLEKLPFEIDEFELLRRSMYHDLSKFNQDLVDGYLGIAEYKDGKKLGLPIDHINVEKLYDCCATYYPMEPHHMEYHIKNGTTPSNVDICEMCCDWAACSDRDGEKDYTKQLLTTGIHEWDFFMKKQDVFVEILTILMNRND